MIKLSPRLKKIANYVCDNSSILDVGCDHALLDIYLMQNRKNINIIASDINENALSNAKKNIKKYKLDNKITTILSNGLDNINTTNIDTLIISGMGSHTIVSILYNNIKKTKNINNLIIQSNNDIDFLRYKVTKLGYYINQEELVKDAGIIYTIIHFKKGYRFYTKKQLYLGPCLLKEKSLLFKEKCQTEVNKLNKFYPYIPNGHLLYKTKIYFKIKILKTTLNSFKV